MKKLLYFILIGFVFGLYSCEEDTGIFKYDGPNYVSFIESSSDFTAIGGETNAFLVEIGVTTSSTSPRTYTLVIDTAASTGEEGTHFTVDSKEVSIAAGDFKGAITVTPVFDEVPLDGISVTFNIINTGDTAAYSIMTHTIDIGKYCNLDLDAFVGEYTVTDGLDSDVCTIARDPEDALFGLIITDPLSYWTGTGNGGVLKIKLNACDNSVAFSSQATGAIHSTYGNITMTQAAATTFDPTTYSISIDATHTVDAGSFGNWVTTFTKN